MQKQIPLARIRDDSISNGWRSEDSRYKGNGNGAGGTPALQERGQGRRGKLRLRESGGKPPHSKTGWAGGYDE
jgi:hypothetical protein